MAGNLSGEVQITEHLGGETFLTSHFRPERRSWWRFPGQVDTRPGERIGLNVEQGKHHFFAPNGAVMGAFH